ncbi:CitMHS family transporter [Floricoccus penangensis]|uniref:CitMHS family transporter n=1 Tax=Floricoccus penangensis TaxID=1859475 RepID=UPI002040A3B6|nr:citrate:proton symporter [Floricoccus penangensis]URZ87249.1 citrate:proton symporter [Floricoccus penangensis]
MLTLLAYLMIICFMAVIMTKKMSAFTALTTIPIVFAVIAIISGQAHLTGSTKGNIKILKALAGEGAKEVPKSMDIHMGDLGTLILEGIKSVSVTGIMLLFAILFFSTMLDAGLFDPITEKMVFFAKGDPKRVLMATAVVAAAVSLNGDGTTTTLICCSAFLPIYDRLGMKRINLAVLVILQNTIMNLLPWGGPTARAMSVLDVGGDILTFLLPGMILSLAYMIFFVANRMGNQERKRLGVKELSDAELRELTVISDEETLAIRRPKNWAFNAILTVGLIAWLVAGSFIPAIEVPPAVLFLVATSVALLVNYPNLKDQGKRIGANGGDAVQVIILVFGAGVLMGLFNGTGMADAIANNLTTIIPKSLGGFWGIVVAIVSAPGTFFISNDGFYYGVMPALAKAGNEYGFDNMHMAVASLMGQAFHLLSPLVAFIYLLLRLTEVDMGEWQKEAGKYAIGIFIIFLGTSLILGTLTNGAWGIPFFIAPK